MSAGLDEVRRAVDGVEGWLSDDQVAELHRAASALRPDAVAVEIGSFRGRSTIVLALAAPPGVQVVAIDPHAGNDRGPQEIEGFEREAAGDHAVFLANLVRAGVAGTVRVVRRRSDEAHDQVEGEVALLFVDGAHRYRPARRDLAEWGRRVEPGGVMLVHDSFSSVGVTLAIGRELLFGRRFRYAGRVRSLAVYVADLEPGWRARAVNASRQLAQVPWFLTNLVRKVLLTLGAGAILERLGRPRPEWPY